MRINFPARFDTLKEKLEKTEPPEEKLFEPPDDARLVEVVGRHLHFHAVAHGQADPAFAHLAANGGEDEVLVVEFDAEHGSGQNGRDATFDFNVFFFHADKPATGNGNGIKFGIGE